MVGDGIADAGNLALFVIVDTGLLAGVLIRDTNDTALERFWIVAGRNGR